MQNHIKQYLDAGFFIFPCIPGYKKPATAHGCLDATNEHEVVDEMWGKNPLFNIGIACGPSKLVVVDVDDEASWTKFLSDTKQSEPLTLNNKTGCGRQLVFKTNSREIRNSASRLADRIDVRGAGGYIIAPPSIHPSGAVYEWIGGFDPARIATIPEWLENILVVESQAHAEPIPGHIGHGERHPKLFSIAGTMRRRGCQEPEILAALTEVNKRCDPPLPIIELQKNG